MPMLAILCSAVFAKQPLDKTKYITIDQIKPGMNAYCLTVYEGTKIDKFGLEVVSIIRNFEPGRSAIIVKGTDPRFIYTGPVAGCSGSPVYIDGRLAGALSFALSAFSKDPLYGVTPIEEMLDAGKAGQIRYGDKSLNQNLSAWNFSNPVDMTAAADTFIRPAPAAQGMPNGASALPSVLTTSELPASVAKKLNAFCSPLGLVQAAGLGGGSAEPNLAKKTKLEPGSAAVVPLVDGDIRLAVLGTITDVEGDTVYAFGHGLLGHGDTDLPLATGQINTVVANLIRSFKYGNALNVSGALTTDEATAVVGKIGKKARTIPLSIKIERYNDPEQRIYNCQLVNNKILSPMMLMISVSAASFMWGPLPPEHCVNYKTRIGLDGFEPIVFENVSSGDNAAAMINEVIGSTGLLLNNPYGKVGINSVDVEAKITPKNIVSHIWSLTLSDAAVKAGQTLDVSVVVEPYLAPKKTYDFSLDIPSNLKGGEYELMVMGAAGYEQFLRRTAPERFRADNLPNLLGSIHNLAQIRRDRLYLVFVLPASGVTIEDAVLSDLPPSKAVILQDDKRALNLRPCQDWIEKSVPADLIVSDSKTVRIKVEEQ
jgi:hypothetical protein